MRAIHVLDEGPRNHGITAAKEATGCDDEIRGTWSLRPDDAVDATENAVGGNHRVADMRVGSDLLETGMGALVSHGLIVKLEHAGCPARGG